MVILHTLLSCLRLSLAVGLPGTPRQIHPLDMSVLQQQKALEQIHQPLAAINVPKTKLSLQRHAHLHVSKTQLER
jgi:hypothetical protein